MHEMVVVNSVAAKGSDGGGLSLRCRDRLAIYSARSLPLIIHYFSLDGATSLACPSIRLVCTPLIPTPVVPMALMDIILRAM